MALVVVFAMMQSVSARGRRVSHEKRQASQGKREERLDRSHGSECDSRANVLLLLFSTSENRNRENRE